MARHKDYNILAQGKFQQKKVCFFTFVFWHLVSLFAEPKGGGVVMTQQQQPVIKKRDITFCLRRYSFPQYFIFAEN
jgi:hypothetical protein